MTEPRLCACGCGKVLEKREKEKEANFKRRRFSSRKCAMVVSALRGDVSDYFRNHGYVWATFKTISAATNGGPRSILKSLYSLHRKGYLKRRTGDEGLYEYCPKPQYLMRLDAGVYRELPENSYIDSPLSFVPPTKEERIADLEEMMGELVRSNMPDNEVYIEEAQRRLEVLEG